MKEEELITLETAKLAKEKGFDITCVWYYHDKCKEFPVEKGGGKIKVPLNWNSDDNKMTVKCYSAPTQSLLQRWLREEHKIHITVDITEKEGKYYYYLNGNMITAFNTKIELDVVYVTYEEALEEGLKNSLNEI